MLVLFDIDGTLLMTQRAGTRSMESAARELFGDHFTAEGVSIAGRIDPLIWADLARANGIDDPDAVHEQFQALYFQHLERLLMEEASTLLLPGVSALVESLRADDTVTLGLLTGNYPQSGRLKVCAAGLNMADFPVAVWGSDGLSRRDLPVIAMARHHQAHGVPPTPEHVVVIGDTPHDVDCARVNGCRSLAVATGTFTAAELVEAGADLVVDDLTDTTVLHEWIVRTPAVG